MKNIILFVFLLINFYSYSQKLDEGRYCTTPIGESDVICIDILNNNHFKYVHSGCLGIQEFGTGKYEIKKQNLILHFDNTKAKKLQRATIINSINQNKDSVTLKFNVKDAYNLPIYGVNIFTDKSFKKRKG